MTPPALFAALQDLLAALAHAYRPDFRAAIAAAGLGHMPVGVLLRVCDTQNGRDPRPLTVENLLACVPYYAPAAFAARLAALTERGWLSAGPDGHTLTAQGQAAAEALYGAVRARLAGLAPLPAADLAHLAALLDALVAAGVSAGHSSRRACALASGTARPNPESAPLARAAWSLEALTNQRCDAHRAAWQPLGLSGPALETLTWLWEARADSIPGLYAWSAAQPFPRGFSAQDYNGFVSLLAGRGWAALEPGGAAAITAAGRRVRGEVEAQTDALFYDPWEVVPEAEREDLHRLAQAATAALRE
ncbi:MAG: hypothetical protein IT317_04115 [Anaerolineales bacterium]|nr:hypothetical protein [Anaerolineales bacterium]